MNIAKSDHYLSNMCLATWRGDLTLFLNFYDPLPADELVNPDWAEYCDYVAMKPAIGPDKDKLPFVISCLLQDAPLTDKMRAKTGKVSGKQRSAAHVTKAKSLTTDADGLDEATFDQSLEHLRRVGGAFLAYNTHSHGRPDKPGIRARLHIPVDRPLNAAEYKQAWLGFDQSMFGGAVAAKDASGKYLHQQQGIWAISADRLHLAFKERNDGAVWRADALIAAAPLLPVPPSEPYHQMPLPTTEQVRRISAALPWLDAETTEVWMRAMTAFKAASQIIGHDAAKELALRYSNQGSDMARARNHRRQYDPAEFFENVKPTMPSHVAVGVICGLARDGALRVVAADQGKPHWSVRGHQAAVYLCRYHVRTFEQVVAE